MKTLLLRPFVDSTVGISPPLCIMYLSSFLKSKGLKVKLIDNLIDRQTISRFNVKNKAVQNLLGKIKDYNPDIIGMTLFSGELTEIAMLCKLIRKEFESVYIVLGGPHPTTMPDETMKDIPECDFVVRGEAEYILYDLIKAVSGAVSLYSIRGISFRSRNDGKIFHCDDAAMIEKLDSIPFPDRIDIKSGYSGKKYGSIIYGYPSDIIVTSRGCPFQCNFCFKVCKKYRSRSPENVIKEIEWIVENNSPRSIQIMDDSFTIEKERSSRILEYLIEKKFQCRFKIRSRVDGVDEGLLRKMKMAGVDTIVYGFESGSQYMLQRINKKISIEQNFRACRMTKREGIDCYGDMILFYPGENQKTLRETEEFIKLSAPTGVRFYILSPLPGTKIYNDAKENGYLVGDWKVNEKSPWIRLQEFKNLDDMERIARRMLLKVLLKPRRIYWLLRKIIKNLFANPKSCVKLFWYLISKKVKY